MERTKYRLEKYTMARMAISMSTIREMDSISCFCTAAREVIYRTRPSSCPPLTTGVVTAIMRSPVAGSLPRQGEER